MHVNRNIFLIITGNKNIQHNARIKSNSLTKTIISNYSLCLYFWQHCTAANARVILILILTIWPWGPVLVSATLHKFCDDLEFVLLFCTTSTATDAFCSWCRTYLHGCVQLKYPSEYIQSISRWQCQLARTYGVFILSGTGTGTKTGNKWVV